MSNNDVVIKPPVEFPKQELTIEQAFNVLEARIQALKGSRVKDWAEKQVEKTPISVVPFQDRVKFLTYALSLCKGQPKFVGLLQIRLFMASHPRLTGMPKREANQFIAQQLTMLLRREVRASEIQKLEAQAIDFVQQEIRRTKATCLPLVGQ